jgi:hypothetical protein
MLWQKKSRCAVVAECFLSAFLYSGANWCAELVCRAFARSHSDPPVKSTIEKKSSSTTTVPEKVTSTPALPLHASTSMLTMMSKLGYSQFALSQAVEQVHKQERNRNWRIQSLLFFDLLLLFLTGGNHIADLDTATTANEVDDGCRKSFSVCQ